MFDQTFANQNPNSNYQLGIQISKARFDFLFEPLQVHIAVVVAIVVVVRRASGVTNYVIIVINCIGQCHHLDMLGRCIGLCHDRGELQYGMYTAVYSTL